MDTVGYSLYPVEFWIQWDTELDTGSVRLRISLNKKEEGAQKSIFSKRIEHFPPNFDPPSSKNRKFILFDLLDFFLFRREFAEIRPFPAANPKYRYFPPNSDVR